MTPLKQCPAAATESATAPEQHPVASALRWPSTLSPGTPGTKALTDLVDLAEEGMTLTQYKYTGENFCTPKSSFNHSVSLLQKLILRVSFSSLLYR